MPSLAMLSSCRAAQGLVGTLNPARGGPRLLLPLQLPQPHLPLQQNASTRIPFLGSRNRPRPLRPARFRIGEDDRTSSSMGSILEAGEAQELLLSAHHLLCNTERRLGDYCSTFVPSRQPPPTPSPPTSTQPNPASIKGEHPPNAYPASGPADEDDAAAAVAGAAGAGEPTTATGSRCWHLYGSFHVARQRLEADACAEVVTRGHPGPACEKLETLERLVRELQYVPTEDMYRVLRTNERLLGDLLGAGGQHLDESDVEQICLELGSNGCLDRQTFRDIVEAQRLSVPGSDGLFLRHLHHTRPEWWSDTPNFLDKSM